MSAEAAVPTSVAREQPVRVIFGALMLVVLLASLDQTIVATALPTIVRFCDGLCRPAYGLLGAACCNANNSVDKIGKAGILPIAFSRNKLAGSLSHGSVEPLL